MTVNRWSTTAASNNTSDSTINLREGQAPSSLNDSNRAMMAALAKLRDDLGAKSVTAGTSAVYTLTSNQVFAALADGLIIGFEPHVDCAADPDINVDGLGAVDLLPNVGGTFAAGDLKAGGKYLATYDATGADWIVHGALSSSAASILAKLLTVDGAGSGLDADLLDGNSSAYYQAASGYTAADVLSKLLTVDGAGSGLDADLLDGQSSAFYAPVASPTFTGVPAAPTAAAGTSTTQIATTEFVGAVARRLGGVWTMNVSGIGTITNIVAVEAVGGTLTTTGDGALRFTYTTTRTRRTPVIILLGYDQAGTDKSYQSFETGNYAGADVSLLSSATALNFTITSNMYVNGTLHLSILD